VPGITAVLGPGHTNGHHSHIVRPATVRLPQFTADITAGDRDDLFGALPGLGSLVFVNTEQTSYGGCDKQKPLP